MNENHVCNCRICNRHRTIRRILEKLSKEDSDTLMEFFEDLECAEEELDCIKCGVDKGYMKMSSINEKACLIVKENNNG